MYEPFFGLDSSPFGLTPNPRFLFRSSVHHEILSLLLYGVTTSKGVMLLLGDVGTGKTTLCRALLRELPAEAAEPARPGLRQPNQRGGIRRRVRPLSERGTFRYVEHRLRAAGLAGSLPFTWGATARVHRYSRGVPRVINLVCDRALSTAFAGRKRNVDVDTVKAAIRSVEGRPLVRWARRVAAVAAVTVVAAVGTTLGLQWTWRSGWFVSHASNSVLAAVAQPAAPTLAPTPRPSSAPEPSSAPKPSSAP